MRLEGPPKYHSPGLPRSSNAFTAKMGGVPVRSDHIAPGPGCVKTTSPGFFHWAVASGAAAPDELLEKAWISRPRVRVAGTPSTNRARVSPSPSGAGAHHRLSERSATVQPATG